MNSMHNLDASNPITLQNLIIDLFAVSITVGYMLFSRIDTNENNSWAFAISLGVLVMLLIGGIFTHRAGKSNNVSMLGYLLFFGGLFGIVGLWRNLNATTSTTSPIGVMGQLKYLGAFIAYALIMTVLYLVNPGGWMTQFGGLTVFVSLFIGLLLLFISVGYESIVKQMGGVSPMLQNLGKGMFILLALTIAGLLFWWFATYFENSEWTNIMFNLIIFAGALVIVYKAMTHGGWLNNSPLYKLISNGLLYIPCLMTDIVKWFSGGRGHAKNPFADTTKNDMLGLATVLGIGTTAFVVFNWIIPGLKKWYFLKGGKQLINEPVSLAKQYSGNGDETMTFQALNAPLTSDLPDPTYTYGISFWIYLDSFAPNTNGSYTQEVTVLNYGGVPLVQYSIPSNTLNVYVSKENMEGGENGDNNHHKLIHAEKHVRLQKWNNVVINYLNGVMDVFYNGELVSSVGSISPPMTFDVLKVGENNGVEGNMANLVYYKQPLSLYFINTLYNSLKHRSPPAI